MRALDTFRSTLIDLKAGSRGQLSTKLAAEIASNLAIGLYETIYAQIDPTQLGSIERSANIASDYGNRLKTKNVKKDTIDKLVSSYSSHSFVIDIEEAKTLFEKVRMPDEDEEKLAESISHVCREPAKEVFAVKLNKKTEIKNDQTNTESADQGINGATGGSKKDNTPAPEANTNVS